MTTHLLAAGMFAFIAAAAPAAVVDSAEALWKFDAADAGSVSLTQVVDSNNGHDATNLSNAGLMNWTTTPADGPTVDLYTDHGRGLQLNPTVQTPGDPEDTVNAAGFSVNGFTVTGSATFATRFKWDGFANDDASGQSAWLYNNGHGASTGWLVGIQNLGGQTRIGQFQYQNGAMRSPASMVINTGVWYDLVVVMLNAAEEGSGTDQLRFFLQADGATVQTAVINGAVNATSAANTYVGSEALGTGGGNVRKAFDGTVDYIGVWDSALTDEQAISILVPEPTSISVIGLLGGAAMLRRRRRA
ncbi:PEP-CTERM sorting domain-containing protein [Planctomycetales bacterium ZRK34]|nr:PEP-CTERM sorting domain-containing protein [Planctomycetales bacterium ZRK34]